MNLNELTPKELEVLYVNVRMMRAQVLELVDKYGYSASQLVSRTFEGDIERFYGKKVLKENKND
jgi:hypothetical protein